MSPSHVTNRTMRFLEGTQKIFQRSGEQIFQGFGCLLAVTLNKIIPK